MDLFTKILPILPLYVLLFLSAGSAVAGDYFAKLWSVSPRNLFLIISLIAYFFSGFFFIPSLLKEGLIITSVIWSLITIIGFLVIGFLIFKEPLSFWQIIGVCFGVVSLVILTIAEYIT